MLEPLERDGFVAIEQNETDHRRRSVQITDKGAESLKQMAEDAQVFLNRLYENIAPDELYVAGKVLKEMMSNLEGMQGEMKQ